MGQVQGWNFKWQKRESIRILRRTRNEEERSFRIITTVGSLKGKVILTVELARGISKEKKFSLFLENFISP